MRAACVTRTGFGIDVALLRALQCLLFGDVRRFDSAPVHMEKPEKMITDEYPERDGCTVGCAAITVVILIAMAAGILCLFA